MQQQIPSQPDSEESLAKSWLRQFFLLLSLCLLFIALIIAPFSFLWLYGSGDAGIERAVARQASGNFTIFGSALSQDFIDYKLRLYAAVKPRIIALGSSRVMQFRGAWFRESFVNMGGACGNLAELRYVVNAMLKISRPEAVILGLDFWWFLPQWEQNPEAEIRPEFVSYNYSLNNLKKPWLWLLEGKIGPGDLAAPFLGVFGKGFRADRYGIMAQKTDDGFGPDGSWYYAAELTGLKKPFDFQFKATLQQVEYGIKAFYHAEKGEPSPSPAHLQAFAEIWCRLRSRGIKVFVFLPPLAEPVYTEMKKLEHFYPHLFQLRKALAEMGIDVENFSNPVSLASGNCEFIDGFHGGETTYARILRQMADHWPALMPLVHMEKLDAIIRDWQDHALVPDKRVTLRPETDFMQFNCPKTASAPKD